MNLQRRLAEIIIERRRAIGICALLLSLLMAAQLRHFKISLNARADLPAGSPEVAYFDYFNRLFNAREILVVAIESPDAFTPENLAYLKTLTAALAQVDGVGQALSLINVPEFGASGTAFTARRFLEPIPVSAAELARKKQQALANRQWVRTLVSPDGTMTAINLILREAEGDPVASFQIVTAVRQALARAAPPPGVKVHMTGIAPLLADSIGVVRSDLRHFLWLTPLLVTALLWVMFRSRRAVAAALGVITLTVLWTFGLICATGRSVNMITTTLPILVAVTCLSDLIYITALYYELSADLADRREVLARTIERMIGPCLLTSVSAAIGFGSLAFSDLQSVRELGLFAAVAVLIAYLLGLTLLPLALAWGAPPSPSIQRHFERAFTTRVLARLVRFWERDRIIIILAVLVCLALSAIGLARLRAETQVSSFLPRSASSVRGYLAIQNKMAGFSSIEMTLTGPPGTFQQAWALAELDKLQGFLQSQPGVDITFSLADFVKQFHQIMNGGDPKAYALPDQNLKIAGYFSLFHLTGQGALLNFFVAPDYSVARVSARIRSMSSAGHLDLLRRIEDFARAHADQRLAFRTTGLVKLYATSVTSLVAGQVRSMFVSILLILLLFIVRMGSIKAGLLVMFPNVLPVLMTLGLMGLLGITLNMSTVMVASIAIGFVVDDTIQILSRYRRELAGGAAVVPAMRATILRGGRAYCFSSIVIAAGFSILAFSSFGPNRHLGILIAFTMLTAMAADLALTPFLVKRFNVK